MTTLACNKALTTAAPATDIRSTLTKNRTTTIDSLVVDKVTGEIVGSYVRHDYAPEAYDYPAPFKQDSCTLPVAVVLEDGSPFFLPVLGEDDHKKSAEILLLPVSEVSSKSNAGRPASTATNPIAGLLQCFRFDGYSTAWMDDYICGAAGVEVECEEGASATTGRFNVALSDVRRVLYLQEISTEAAAPILCNHKFQPMSIRQVERVVKAAWIALGGLMLHLERHQELLHQFDYIVDFNEFWLHRDRQNRGESPKKAEVILLLAEGEKIAAIAKRTGVHRNTVSRWKRKIIAI
ncbi:hypothetical protein CRX42_09695 [Pseudomonas jessenii]|uniref:Uncharacterized protein n=1 Tax=Pseudomonas jessenii TaxID=77298 RepID=A0A2W0EQQ8_PSEJE|nr:helix-turn-helix domain-containing protein [Pseudomonas jessenii]PYY70769.1 hypothetical protein CRX42_09695 [Pseudomonas jessenii]